eukprot:CAMPEP_0175254388 /NCGR_PEP_ID=MMETSP0093-20121207/37165_1 /TAXON_ID=311494 /ORGANISM="Alexandrium monilatum, Strain CCMP3105" /LENGTH=316 /DNA_ID=CAMNT_0016548707 /DNA_START=53 /DNA_END=1003 /DNA_ORIENTATION=-
MAVRIQVATRIVSASALLLSLLGAGASDPRGTVDELSFVQMSAAQQEAAQEAAYEDAIEGIFHRHGHNATSLLALHGIPHVKSIKQQLEAGPGKMSPPEQGYHKKVVKALPILQAECKTKPYATEEDCNLAEKLLTMFTMITEGPTPNVTVHGYLRDMVGLSFWLYTPGTMVAFSLLDMDKNTGVTFEEMVKLFGIPTMAIMHPMWGFLDLDHDGNMTRQELHRYLRAAIMVREVLPELDGMDPTADTRKCLNMAHRVLVAPVQTKRMAFYPKLLSIAGIGIGAFLVHCLISSVTRGSKKAAGGMDENAGKSADGR